MRMKMIDKGKWKNNNNNKVLIKKKNHQVKKNDIHNI